MRQNDSRPGVRPELSEVVPKGSVTPTAPDIGVTPSELRVNDSNQPTQCALKGKLELVTQDHIAGWAWDENRPNVSIQVDVFVDGVLLTTVAADRGRKDLEDAKLGNGRHAFIVTGTAGLLQNARHVVNVKRSFDGVDLANSPVVLLREKAGLDESAQDYLTRLVKASVDTASRPFEFDELLQCLLSLINVAANARARSVARDGLDQSSELDYVLSQASFSDWTAAMVSRLCHEFSPIHIDEMTTPTVSIIIPVYNQFRHTYNCLISIVEHFPNQTFEIIIADDCSSDETLLCGIIFTGAIRIVRHPRNLGFIRSCNAAARLAKGNFLFFLNNDTLVKDGWLDELVETFKAVPNVGIAGSKLLFEDGRLQEAGGIVWRLGDGWNWGRNKSPEEPSFCYLRDADWVSGAALMIERSLFETLGGFDELYLPAYYEDTDLAFRVRALGRRVVMQPASEIVHLEGKTSGTDVTGTGVKRYQLVNHRKFFKRWKDTLAGHRLNGDHPELEAERLVRRRALFIDDSVPTPDQDAGSNAALQHMRALLELGYKVTFLPSDNMAQIDPYTKNLQKLGIECLYAPYYWSVEEVVRKMDVTPDLVYLHRYSNASKYLYMLRQRFPKCKIVYNVADLHFLRDERQAKLENDPARLQSSADQRKLEIALMRQSDCTIVHSSFEASLLREIDNLIPTQVVHWTVNTRPVHTPFDQRSGFLFVGGYRHLPNVDAAMFLASDIMPLVRNQSKGLCALLIGSHMPDQVRALACEDIRIVGYVPSLDPIFNQVRCSVVPLRYGAGIKGKVLESFAHGIPCVMTEVAAEGLDLPEELTSLVVNTPRELAKAVIELHEDRAFNKQMSKAGLTYVQEKFNSSAVSLALSAAIG